MRKFVSKKAALVVCAIMACSLFLVGCTGNNGNSTTSAAGGTPAATTPQSTAAASSADTPDVVETAAGKDTIVLELHMAPNVLDPQVSSSQSEWQINSNIYSNLFVPYYQDPTNYVPWLVESYEVSDDNTDWTFKLREGVLFHNGDELTSEDVVYMLERAKVKPVSASAAATFTGFTAVDKYTVLLEQDVTFPSVIQVLGELSYGVGNKKLIEEYGEGSLETIVGTGPYKLVSWDSDKTVTVEYFEDYFRAEEAGEPAIKKCSYRTITDANAATIAFDSGDLDVFLRNVLLSDYERFRADPELTVLEITQSGTRGFSMNYVEGQFTDVRVRRAVNHCLDREAINLIVAEGQYNAPVWTKIDSRAEGFDYAVEQGLLVEYEYNVDKALALMKDAGYDENNKLNANMVCSVSQVMQSLSSAMQDYLTKVNITVEVETMEHAQYLQRVSTGNYECATSQWGFQYYLSPMLYRTWCYPGQYFNYEQYNNPRVMEIIDEAAATWELSEREVLYAELLNILTDEAVQAPVYQICGMIVTRDGLHVYSDDTNLILPLEYMHY